MIENSFQKVIAVIEKILKLLQILYKYTTQDALLYKLYYINLLLLN